MGTIQSDQTIGVLVIIGVVLVIILKVIVAIWLFLLVGLILFIYFGWQSKKLKEYNGDWKAFCKRELKSKVRVLVFIAPVLLCIGVCTNSDKREQEGIIFAKQTAEKELLELVKKQVQIRRDSSNYLLLKANQDFDKKRYKKCLKALDSAILIFSENYEAIFRKGEILQKRGKYKDALAVLNSLEYTDYRKSDLYLEKGKCFLKLRENKEAAIQLYKSVLLNNSDAISLYEKINPYRKKISYYLTRCCDGTTSNAKGRGACSHHGGVCNWNEPVYYKVRKYQIE